MEQSKKHKIQIGIERAVGTVTLGSIGAKVGLQVGGKLIGVTGGVVGAGAGYLVATGLQKEYGEDGRLFAKAWDGNLFSKKKKEEEPSKEENTEA
jgi:uncharacterized membrane protein